MAEKQKTIVKEASVKGVGLHTAHEVVMTFKPAEVGSGINFVRTDIKTYPVIKAVMENLLPPERSPRRTSLGNKDGVEIHTIEHLMAALAGLGIDNLCVELNNDEIPGLDGSSLQFVELLFKAGIKEQDKEKQYLVVREPVFIEEAGSSIAVFPAQEFKLSYTLSFDHPLLKASFRELTFSPEVFQKDLASARTFCLADESIGLKQQGLGLGANYNNTLVVGKSGVINNTLRFDDEFVRHKMLDLIGDLYVLGQPIKAQVIAIKSGHSLNLKLIQKLEKQRQQMGTQMDIEMIMKILPHRWPFLFVDRITYMEEGKFVVGIKNVTLNDYFFQGHFPSKPVMPGVLIIEAMAQVGGVMMLSIKENRGKLAFFLTADNIKFRKTVVPGDQLVFEVTAGRIKSKTGQVHGVALVDGKVVAEADLMFALSEN